MTFKQQVSEIQIDVLRPIGRYSWMNKSIYIVLLKFHLKSLFLNQNIIGDFHWSITNKSRSAN